MENGQEKSNTETLTNGPTDDEVKNEMPVSIEENAAKQTSEEPSNELLEKIKKQVEVIFDQLANYHESQTIIFSYVLL